MQDKANDQKIKAWLKKSDYPVRRPEESPERQSSCTSRAAKSFRKQGRDPKSTSTIQETPQRQRQREGQMAQAIIPREESAIDNVFNMARTLIDFTNKGKKD
ncbi:hypothetical protein O181_057029 [Austropuccinia psidii MF-1]|uniref:Uncharacterized protein n=1 Tax=Austropuccinia psidii MF-1 TaxID=1389203 RepID=A0A9Q3HW99_9BASI|nr:hypothetical protein [Austropuccinia psidii MF-1]